MIIHRPKKTISGDRVRISAFIESESRPKLSDTLWFDLPSEFSEDISAQSNAFAAISMLPSMVLGEDLIVRGQLSPKLFHGLYQYQKIFHGWFPHMFKPVDIRCQDLAAETVDRTTQAEAAAFSGGIDSFYTLLRHSPAPGAGQDAGIRYLLLIGGFDIPLNDVRTFAAVKAAYKELAASRGLVLIDILTNFKKTGLAGTAPWILVGGSVLGAVAHVLSPKFFRYYIASSHKLEDDFHTSVHPTADPLLSLDNMEVIHDHPASRVVKTRLVAMEPHSYRYLRVCWENKDGINNCCRCQKCIRTMLTLDLIGALGRYETFPFPLTRNVRGWALYGEVAMSYAQEILEEARALEREDLAADIERAIRRSRVTLRLAQAAARPLFLDAQRTELLVYLFFRIHKVIYGPDHLWRVLRRRLTGPAAAGN